MMTPEERLRAAGLVQVNSRMWKFPDSTPHWYVDTALLILAREEAAERRGMERGMRFALECPTEAMREMEKDDE